MARRRQKTATQEFGERLRAALSCVGVRYRKQTSGPDRVVLRWGKYPEYDIEVVPDTGPPEPSPEFVRRFDPPPGVFDDYERLMPLVPLGQEWPTFRVTWYGCVFRHVYASALLALAARLAAGPGVPSWNFGFHAPEAQTPVEVFQGRDPTREFGRRLRAGLSQRGVEFRHDIDRPGHVVLGDGKGGCITVRPARGSEGAFSFRWQNRAPLCVTRDQLDAVADYVAACVRDAQTRRPAAGPGRPRHEDFGLSRWARTLRSFRAD